MKTNKWERFIHKVYRRNGVGMKERYVLEGEWSGYRSSQRRVCHRGVVNNPNDYKDLNSILFTDGTTLDLSLRKCLPRERIDEIHGYDKLISDCLAEGVSAVSDLRRYKAEGEN